MDTQSSRGGFDDEILSGESQVVNRGAILLLIARESQTNDCQSEDRRGLGPSLIRLDETGEEPCELLRFILSMASFMAWRWKSRCALSVSLIESSPISPGQNTLDTVRSGELLRACTGSS